MGNIFDPKRLMNHNQLQHDKDNLSVTVPQSRIECTMLINGYLRKTIDESTTKKSIIPMDIIDIIGIFHPYLNMIERKAAKICQKTIKICNSPNLFPRPKTYSMSKTVKYLMDEYNKLGYFIIKNGDPHTMIVNFLYYQGRQLDKQVIGAYFASNNDMIMLKEYLNLFDFRHESIDIAMRKFLCRCCLLGEAQIIDRIIQLFAEKYYDDYVFVHVYNDDLCVDDVYILAYSIIMLNPSLHNPLVRNPMTKDQFTRNSKIALSSNAAKGMLDGIYDRVKATKMT